MDAENETFKCCLDWTGLRLKLHLKLRPYESLIYIYIIYTPNLGLGTAVFVRERKQDRFRGSTEGAEGSWPLCCFQ